MLKQFKEYKLNKTRNKALRRIKKELVDLEYKEENIEQRMAMFQRMEKLL